MKRILSALIALIMMITVPAEVLAAGTGYIYEADRIAADDFGPDPEDYVEGDVIVCVRGGEEALSEALSGEWSIRRFFRAASDYTVEDVLASFEAESEPEAQEASQADADPAPFVIEFPGSPETDLNVSYPVESTNVSGETDDILLLHTSDTGAFIRKVSSLPCVLYAQPDYICEPEQIGGAEEPLYYAQQHLDNSDGDSDTGAAEAWNRTSGTAPDGEPIVVAVMDSGVDYTHPDLRDVMWDEGLMYPELTALGGGAYGINTSGEGPTDDPRDMLVGHGTHCASIIAGAWNQEGISGINGNARIMACRWMGALGRVSDYIKAVSYVITARDAGVNVAVTSNSWGSTSRYLYQSPAIYDMERRLNEAGIISLYSAGNSGYDHDAYPETTHLSQDLSLIVGASDSEGGCAVFSDYGRQSVDVMAPGVNVLAAASLSEDVTTMKRGYYPWLDSTGSILFCDMEDGNDIPVCACQAEPLMADPEKDEANVEASPSDASPSDASPSDAEGREGKNGASGARPKPEQWAYSETAVRQLYGDADNHALCFDIDFEAGEAPAFDIGFRLTPEQESLLPEDGNVYLSFQTARTGVLSPCSIKGFTVYVRDADSGEFTEVGNLSTLMIDPNWNPAEIVFSSEGISDLTDENGEMWIRFISSGVQSESGPTTIYIDNIGVGTQPGPYKYSCGTSMACPLAAGTLTLILEKLYAENRDGAKSDIEIAREALAYLKGGVRQNESLYQRCSTGGVIDAAASVSGDVGPVPVQLTDNGDGTSTLSGYFFGDAEGSVDADGDPVGIISWSDREIVIESDAGPEHDAEIIVTAASGRTGRDFLRFGNGDNGYRLLPPLPVSVSDVKLAAAGDTVLCIADEGAEDSDYALAFWKYDTGTEEWSRVPLPEGLIAPYAGITYQTALASGSTEIYVLIEVDEDQQRNPGRLLTYDTLTGDWTYDTEVDIMSCAEGPMCVYNGELILVGSDENPGVRKVYPDTGEVYGTLPDMPERRGAGQAFQVGQDIIVTGQNNGLMMIIFESMIPGMLEYKETMSYHGSDGTWQGSGRVFFGKDSEYLDQDTWRQCSAVPLKDGLMITGPVRDNGTAEVTDTWRYRADSDTYEAYPVRFDTVRTRNSASCLLDGTMYVMTVSAAPGRDGEVRFASLDISDIAAPACPDAKKSEEHPDPRRKESGDDPRWSGKPRYTGTWDAPVDGGSWSRDGSGYWYYRTNAYFRDTWGYIVNPYADEKQNKADWFRFDRNGRMLTGWQFIDDKWYYLNPVSDGTLGACFIGPGRTPDGYEIDESGAWTGR